ncbi:TauD/TfdA dioxygenase family protein [Kordiimonas pumila]|uniref:TauD/TfdA dioxygenase family protein n=1 Tax=Kordiimonas pumila TaxID=2161677 RepID=A0ABV7D3E4_9PROT|nr:TauD/TfdA family dioxygenase [Kordiimonas pumila]
MLQTETSTMGMPAEFANVTLAKLSETFVLEIRGLDLTGTISDAVIDTLQELLAHHLVLVIRDQHIDGEQQDAITAALGKQRDQTLHTWAPPAEADAQVGRVGKLGQLPILNKGNQLFFINGPELCDTDHDPNVILDMKDQYKMHGTSCWHTGDTEKMNVEVINILSPVIVPEREGHTQFANTTAAFAALDKAAQEKYESLRVLHCMVFPEIDFVDMPENTAPVSQPLVKQNSHTGEKFLYLNFHDMDRVVGYERAKSDALIKDVFSKTIREPFLYSHEWKEGDLVIWNCNGTMHRRGLVDPTTKRALRRTQVEISILQSTREWDKTREAAPGEHNGEYWHPFPLKDDE